MIQYGYWVDFLGSAGAICSPAELHGLVSGVLASGLTQDEQSQRDEALQLMDCPSTPDDNVIQAVAALYPLTSQQLQDPALGFRLLLPDDATPVADRTRALAQWCQGFLHGFAKAGNEGVKRLDEDSADALWDFASIAQLEENPEESETNEVHLTDLSEYVRMAVVNIFSQTRDVSQTVGDSLH